MTQGYGPQNGQQGQWGPQGQEPPQGAQQPQWGRPSPAPAPQWGQQSPPPAPQQGAPQPEQQQWGQPSPAPQAAPQWGQQGQQPAPQASPAPQQWSQASPPPAPGGYPGGGGYPGATGSGASTSATGPASTVSKIVAWMFYAVLAVVAVRLIGNVIVFGIQFAGGATGSQATVGAGNIFGLLVLLANGVVTLALLVLAIMVIVQANGRGRTGAIIVVATVVLAVIAYWILRGILLAVVASATDYSTIGVFSMIYLVAEIIRCLIVFAALIVGGLMARRWAKENA